MAVSPSIVDRDRVGRYRVTRYQLARDAGAAMSTALKIAEPASYLVLTKIDGTYVDTRGGAIAGLTWSVAAEVTSILVDNALLPANEVVFVDVYVGADLGERVGLPAPIETLIIFDGNSLTSGVGSSGAGFTYPDRAMAMLNRPSLHYVNLGVGGQTTAQMASDVVSEVVPLIGTYPRTIVIPWEWVNSIYYGAAVVDVLAAYQSYITPVKAAGALVLTPTMLPCSSAGTPGDLESKRQTLNASLRANWATYSSGLVDFAADNRIGDAGDELNLTYYNADHVHMVDAGYLVAAEVAVPAIEALL